MGEVQFSLINWGFGKLDQDVWKVGVERKKDNKMSISPCKVKEEIASLYQDAKDKIAPLPYKFVHSNVNWPKYPQRELTHVRYKQRELTHIEV